MTLSPRSPVLVGAATLKQREEDFERALEPVELMIRALEAAAEDASCMELLRAADSIRAPRGFWKYPDPCKIIAERFGAVARTEVAEVGVLQTTLFGRAAHDIREGHADIVLITGGEARYRAQRAKAAGRQEALASQPEGTEADSVLRPSGDILTELEIKNHLAMPVGQYAIIDNALRAAEGQSIDAHRREVAALWSRMSDVAADNPDAWSNARLSAEAIRDPEASQGSNRMLAFPYTKLHCSQWNVDQAAGLIMCSCERAQALGIPRERWVFPLAISESNFMLPLSLRRELDRCPGFAEASRQALKQAGCSIEDVDHMELYSCFPAAVRSQLRELGIAGDRALTLTGGMTFGGGPLNNFVLQAVAKMAEQLRADPTSVGLVTAVSGVLTKQGVTLWSTEPRGEGFAFGDVSREAEARMERVEVIEGAVGDARIAGYTVLYDAGEVARAVLLCDLPDGRRALLLSHDLELARAMTQDEFTGREVRLSAEGDVVIA